MNPKNDILISLSPLLSKIIEKVVNDSVQIFLNNNNMIVLFWIQIKLFNGLQPSMPQQSDFTVNGNR